MVTVRALMVALALSTIAFGQNDSLDWPGWRGVERQGVHPSAAPPIEWSIERNVDWVADLPGEEHSSPVISQGRVFVTAAYPVPHRDWLKQLLIALTFGSVGLAAMLGLGVVGSASALLHEPGGLTGIVTIIALPAKDYAFRSGCGSASALVVIVVQRICVFHEHPWPHHRSRRRCHLSHYRLE